MTYLMFACRRAFASVRIRLRWLAAPPLASAAVIAIVLSRATPLAAQPPAPPSSAQPPPPPSPSPAPEPSPPSGLQPSPDAPGEPSPTEPSEETPAQPPPDEAPSAKPEMPAVPTTPNALRRATAMRASARVLVDGKLDDVAWANVPVLTDFTQVAPDEGTPASERTEVRIVYDDQAIYVGFRCFDSHASEISARLGRRDYLPESDWVMFDVDTVHDRRAAYSFVVNAGGVRQDGIYLEGQGTSLDSSALSLDWDGPWEAAAALDADGWSAEMRIPFSTLRFPRADVQTWGFHVRRYISRLRETSDWALIRQSDPSFVGQFAELDGVSGISPGLALQLAPYVSTTFHPSYSRASLAPRDPAVFNAGLDAKYAVTGTLTLDATLNPDFGQTEVDPAVLNLTAFEVYFPEKRQFFLEGLDLLKTVGPYVHTRRIGAAPPVPPPSHGGVITTLTPVARILGAAKLTGNLFPGTGVAWLGAHVLPTTAEEVVADGGTNARYRYHATPATFFQVGRVRQVLFAQSTASAIVTSAVRGDGRPDAHVVATDFDFRGTSDYTATGALGWSMTSACPPGSSPTPLRNGGCDALGASLEVGKTAGEARLFTDLLYAGAQHNLNDVGFLPRFIGNQAVSQWTQAQYFRPRPWGPFNLVKLGLSYLTGWDPAAASSGIDLPMTLHRVRPEMQFIFRNNWTADLTFDHMFPRYDDEETRLNPLVRLYALPRTEALSVNVKSSIIKPFWAAAGNRFEVQNGTYINAATLQANYYAGGRVELGTKATWTSRYGRPRWIDVAPDGFPLFGALFLHQLDMTLRTTVSLTQNLSVQLFGQLLMAAQRYETVYELTNPSTLVDCASGACAGVGPPASYNQNLSALIINAVLRWEFFQGSTLYAVYTHNNIVSGRDATLSLSNTLDQFNTTRADNVIALKLSFLWGL